MHMSVGSNQNIVMCTLTASKEYTYFTFIHNEDQILTYKVYDKTGNDSIGLSYLTHKWSIVLAPKSYYQY